jgi:hypothetical protein
MNSAAAMQSLCCAIALQLYNENRVALKTNVQLGLAIKLLE